MSTPHAKPLKKNHMPYPDPVFSHLDHLVTVHRYGELALRAVHVQNFIHYYQGSPGLPTALATTFQNLTPKDFTTVFTEAFNTDISHLPDTEARILL